MKARKQPKSGKYPPHKPNAAVLRDALVSPSKELLEKGPMIRTQIYLSRTEHDFVQAEAARLGQPMAAVIRNLIDEKMEIPDAVWTNNPMLQPVPEDPD